MISHVGKALWARGLPEVTTTSDDGDSVPQVSWELIIIFLNYLVFIPAFLLIDYTFGKVFPLLAMIEDEKPPAYEPLPVEPLVNGPPKPSGSPAAPGPDSSDGRPVTSSFRATFRLVRSHGGFRASFRGLPCLIAQTIMTGLIIAPFYLCLPYVGIFIGRLVASVLLVQFSVVWVHQVITPPSARSFWSRLPPFKTALKATWRPALIFWAGFEATLMLCNLLIDSIGIHKHNNPVNLGVGILFAALVILIGEMSLLIPAWVVLVRIQASMLPADEDTIVPFDRSFNGRVEPSVVGGPGYATLADAWSSFSKAAWRRIIILNLKIAGVSVATGLLLGAFIFLQILIFGLVNSKGSSNSGNTGA